jgi:hypothetical protein
MATKAQHPEDAHNAEFIDRLVNESCTVKCAPKSPPLASSPAIARSAKDGRAETGARSNSTTTTPEQKRASSANAPSCRRAAMQRVKRTVRLTVILNIKLKQAAKARGLDLNSAIAVAIAEDWRRSIQGATPSKMPKCTR